jgi:predicted nucleotidyltransferase
MIKAIEDEISSWTIKPIHSSLFGSAARGEGDFDSDLDVLIVRPQEVSEPRWEDQKYESGLRLRRKIGNDLSWFDVSRGELKTAKKASEMIFSEWKRDGIFLTGKPLLELLLAPKGRSK